MAMGSSQAGLASKSPAPARGEDEFEEISLVDIVRVIHKRRVALAIMVVLALVGGAAVTIVTPKEYQARAQVIPLEHEAIINNWLESRQAAQHAAQAVGEPLNSVLFPDNWDSTAGTWRSTAPSQEQIAQALAERVTISTASRDRNALISITVTVTDPVVAADIATGYLASLDVLRPNLENITRSTLFDKYYDGTNAQEAQARAERAAAEKSYWIAFDSPTVPDSPTKPRPVLNMALAGILGVMGGVFLVFGLEWLEKYKAEFGRVSPPPKP